MMYISLKSKGFGKNKCDWTMPILAVNFFFVVLRYFRRKSKNFLLHLFYGNIDKIRRSADADILEAEACLGKGCLE
jgi:hypothetical protein